MSELLTRCEVCGSLLDEEDLFCANCGTESPRRQAEPGAVAGASRLATHNFECSGCGASMSFDARAGSLRCPFCASVDMVQQQDTKVLAPQRVVPFRLSRQEAVAAMRKWLGRGFFRPRGLSEQASVVQMQPVYVPYWVFEATTHTYWTADTSQTPPGARGDWYPLAGEHHGRYENLLIGASGALTPAETTRICPFDLAEGSPPEEVDLQNVTVEQFSVPRKYARPLARQGLEQSEARAVENAYVPGRARNVHVNVRMESMSSEPVLLPVWIMAYRYGDKVYRFLVNGQNGRATGAAPISWLKIVLIGVVILAVVLMLLLCLGLLGAGGRLGMNRTDGPQRQAVELVRRPLAPTGNASRRSGVPAIGRPRQTPPLGRGFLLYWPLSHHPLASRASWADDEPQTDPPTTGRLPGR
jgi:predicted RNA-binding Zn-ribbon protein involved in translation (DUF1610 family)